MWENPVVWVAVPVVALLLITFVVLVVRGHREGLGLGGRRPHRDDFRSEESRAALPPRRAAMVVNPTKFADLDGLRAQVTSACLRHGWGEPLFYETTEDDPGTGQARAALADGAAVVCVLGGDGTVRAVAQGLAGSQTPLGLLPSGTGNLLARNIGLPLDGLEESIEVALTGRNEHVDVGRLSIEPAEEGAPALDLVFLVMAGLGFDAAVMGGAPDHLKAKVGWPAYVVSGMRNLRGDRFTVRLTHGDAGHEQTLEKRTRSVVVGNCGRLPAGITLMPEARVDDGFLDCVVISPKTVVGWVAVTTRVLRRATTRNDRVDHYTSTRFVVRPDRPEEVQVDGDAVGAARQMTAEVWPRALIVRMPVGVPLGAEPADPS